MEPELSIITKTVPHADLGSATQEGWSVVSSFQDTSISQVADEGPNPEYVPQQPAPYGGFNCSVGLPTRSFLKNLPTASTYFVIQRSSDNHLAVLQANLDTQTKRVEELEKHLADYVQIYTAAVKDKQYALDRLDASEPSILKLKSEVDILKSHWKTSEENRQKLVKFLARLWLEFGNENLKTILGGTYLKELDEIESIDRKASTLYELLLEV